MSSTEKPHGTAYRAVTEQIIKAIAAGARNAEMPWHRDGSLLVPTNAATGKRYRGINIVALWAAATSGRFGSHLWGTYRQWRSLGAQVRRGERASLVVFFKEIEIAPAPDAKEEEEKRKSLLIARASSVFNADQVDGYQRPAAPEVEPPAVIAEAERLVEGTGAALRHGGAMAFYSPVGDYIQLPERASFTGTKTSSPTESYYAVLLHELVHWSGALPRLSRDLASRFGSRAYAMEELVAELGAAFLCAELGISSTPREDHAAYIADWLTVLAGDPKAIFTAASKAMEASEFLLSLRSDPSREASQERQAASTET